MEAVTRLSPGFWSMVGKVVRYSLVSAVVLPTGSLILWLLLISGLQPVSANVVSVTATTPISYLLNRRWTWGKDGISGGAGEVAAFWWLALVGLLLSSGAVTAAARWTDRPEPLLAANVAAYGAVWVLKFLVLDQFLFSPNAARSDRVRRRIHQRNVRRSDPRSRVRRRESVA